MSKLSRSRSLKTENQADFVFLPKGFVYPTAMPAVIFILTSNYQAVRNSTMYRYLVITFLKLQENAKQKEVVTCSILGTEPFFIHFIAL